MYPIWNLFFLLFSCSHQTQDILAQAASPINFQKCIYLYVGTAHLRPKCRINSYYILLTQVLVIFWWVKYKSYFWFRLKLSHLFYGQQENILRLNWISEGDLKAHIHLLARLVNIRKTREPCIAKLERRKVDWGSGSADQSPSQQFLSSFTISLFSFSLSSTPLQVKTWHLSLFCFLRRGRWTSFTTFDHTFHKVNNPRGVR